MEELHELLEQLVEHLRFYKELGVRRTAAIAKLPDLPPIPAPQRLAPKPVAPAPYRSVAYSVSAVKPGQVSYTEKDSPKLSPAPPATKPTTLASQSPLKPAAAKPDKPAGMLFSLDSGPVDIFAALPKNDSLPAIEDFMGNCQRCKLCFGRKHIVFGMGNPKADLMIIGEAPGADEDQQGLPFVGRAGQLLTRILAAIDLTRDEVYITNVVKCRPPENRKPEKDEIGSCEPFLWRQINVIQPKLICALGATAAQVLLKTTESISSLRGRFLDFHGYKVIATFHPAYLLRNPQDKGLVWQDMKKVRDYLKG